MAFQFLVQAASEETMLNITLLKFFMPLFLFMFVFALMYALLKKTKLVGESPFALMVISFVIAIIFVVTPATFKFTNIITPWLVVFIISLLFIFLILSWLDVFKVGDGGMAAAVGNTWVAWLILIVMLAIFIFAGIATFGPMLSPLNGAEGASGAELIGLETKKFLFHPAILGLALLFIIAAVTAWVLGVQGK